MVPFSNIKWDKVALAFGGSQVNLNGKGGFELRSIAHISESALIDSEVDARSLTGQLAVYDCLFSAPFVAATANQTFALRETTSLDTK